MQTAPLDPMLLPSGGGLADLSSLIPLIAAEAPAMEEKRRLSASLASALARHGLFRLLVPRALGGGERTPVEVLDTIEALAPEDASVAWSVMVCTTTGMLAVYLEPSAAAEIFDDPDAIVGGVAAPRGTAIERADGFEVSGRWSWASASAVCTWLLGGFRVGEDGAHHLAFFPVEQVGFIDDWNPIGLRGTGSGSFEAPGVHVPRRRTCTMPMKPRPGSSPVYAFPPAVMTALGIASVGCGVAQAAFDHVGGDLSEATLDTVTAAFARHRAARALLREQVALAWDTAMAGDDLPAATIARLRLSAVHAARTSASECRVLQDCVGGAGVPFSSPLGRRVRDTQTLTAHALVSPRLHRQLGEQLFSAPANGRP